MLTNHEQLDFDDIAKNIILLNKGNLTLGAYVRHSLCMGWIKKETKVVNNVTRLIYLF
jgi:hypothetical protein